MTRLTLPYPISANRYWISFYAPRLKRVCVGPTKEAKAYRSEVGWIAREAGVRQPTTHPIRLALTLVPKNGVVMDLSNCLKVAEDALQGVAYVNDRQVKAISLAYGEPDGKGALIVEIDEFIPDPPPLFADVDQVHA